MLKASSLSNLSKKIKFEGAWSKLEAKNFSETTMDKIFEKNLVKKRKIGKVSKIFKILCPSL